jgi:hypothetical protein
MATSGSVDWAVTRDDVIKAAYRLVLADEDFTPTTNQTNNAALLLNAIIKSWNVTLDMPLWGMSYAYILPTSNVSSFTVPGTVHVVSAFAVTKLSADAAATDTSITVDSATGIDDTYAIGIEQEDGSMHWTTVSGALVGTTVTLTAALTEDAADGAYVYAYSTTTRIKRPLRIVSANRRDITGIDATDGVQTSNIEIEVITTSEYVIESPDFHTDSTVLKLAYEPNTPSTGTIRIWPQFQDGKSYLLVRLQRLLEDFDTGTDNPDLPVEWNLPLIYQLAITLAPTYSVDPIKLAHMKLDLKEWLDQVGNGDYEEGSIHFYPNRMPC